MLLLLLHVLAARVSVEVFGLPFYRNPLERLFPCQPKPPKTKGRGFSP